MITEPTQHDRWVGWISHCMCNELKEITCIYIFPSNLKLLQWSLN